MGWKPWSHEIVESGGGFKLILAPFVTRAELVSEFYTTLYYLLDIYINDLRISRYIFLSHFIGVCLAGLL